MTPIAPRAPPLPLRRSDGLRSALCAAAAAAAAVAGSAALVTRRPQADEASTGSMDKRERSGGRSMRCGHDLLPDDLPHREGTSAARRIQRPDTASIEHAASECRSTRVIEAPLTILPDAFCALDPRRTPHPAAFGATSTADLSTRRHERSTCSGLSRHDGRDQKDAHLRGSVYEQSRFVLENRCCSSSVAHARCRSVRRCRSIRRSR